MTTAAAQQPSAVPVQHPPVKLWQKPIPILGVTGDFGAGKSRFLLSIAPGPETLLFDTEDSTETYADDIGFKRIDVPKVMLDRYPGGYKSTDTFQWWKETVKTIPPRKFRVIAIDVAEDIEAGMADWVWDNPLAFNHTKQQYLKMSGIYWGDIKAMWKLILTDLASRCETFAFSVHLGKIWADNKPTQQTKPKGKSTLMELATLFLHLERPALPDGGRVCVPSARVLKSRLSHNRIINGSLITTEILPPRLPECTPESIRAYIAKPVGTAALRAEEKAVAQTMTDDQRLELRAQAAASEAEAAALRLQELEMARRSGGLPPAMAFEPPLETDVPDETEPDLPPPTTLAVDVVPSENSQSQVESSALAPTTPPVTRRRKKTEPSPPAVVPPVAAPTGETLQEALAKDPADRLPITPPAAADAIIPAEPAPGMPLGADPVGAVNMLWDEMCSLKGWNFDQNRATWKAAVLDRYRVSAPKEMTPAQLDELQGQIITRIREAHAARGTLSPV